ncbi:MAG: hypothetical protein GY826_30600 [Fuerstiella sp.]|nr:hypothetical protein [Fuerstiella sp.]
MNTDRAIQRCWFTPNAMDTVDLPPDGFQMSARRSRLHRGLATPVGHMAEDGRSQIYRPQGCP